MIFLEEKKNDCALKCFNLGLSQYGALPKCPQVWINLKMPGWCFSMDRETNVRSEAVTVNFLLPPTFSVITNFKWQCRSHNTPCHYLVLYISAIEKLEKHKKAISSQCSNYYYKMVGLETNHELFFCVLASQFGQRPFQNLKAFESARCFPHTYSDLSALVWKSPPDHSAFFLHIFNDYASLSSGHMLLRWLWEIKL